MTRLLLCATAILCLFTACQKAERKMLVGTWKAVAVSYDTNDNGQLEANEKIVPSASEPLTYTFKNNGDLDVNDGKITYPMTWTLKGGNTLTMTLDKQQVVAKILTLTNTDLTWETDVDFLARVEFKKQ
ncbi:MAG: hypothetical protein K0R82_1296 [Flavipsychrobacter sp.]|jgi:hypothetical protein|nr:hypothetical protein [Flavipsychrobacter sp.]